MAAHEKLASDEWKLLTWDAHPITYTYINRRITGDPNLHWLDFILRRFLPDGATYGLSLACGWGNLERHALRIRLCREMDACDISPEALAVATRLAEEADLLDRVHYFQCDLNTASLAENRYDLCFSNSAIHHVVNLEHAFEQIKRALRPSGLLVLTEYVGAKPFPMG